MIRHLVTDIEGTTTSIGFVKEVLFPHARRELPAFVAAHGSSPQVREALVQAKALAGDRAMEDAAVIAVLVSWIDEDRKAGPLKALQGMIWEDGYRSGAFRGHVYADVPGALRRFRSRGIALHVFSSGSVQAQKLLFGHTPEGDLTSLFDRYFDTTTGPKGDPASYVQIAAALGVPPGEVLFLSDTQAELDAARAAGMSTVGLARDGAPSPSAHPVATRFDEIEADEDGVHVSAARHPK